MEVPEGWPVYLSIQAAGSPEPPWRSALGQLPAADAVRYIGMWKANDDRVEVSEG